MTKIGNYYIVKASELPHIQKAIKIARELSEQRIDEILAGRIHLHRNPVKKAKATAIVNFPQPGVTGTDE